MNSLIICVAILVVTFFATYISKRRFGVLGLALAAGNILSGIWLYDAGLLAGFLSIPASFMTTMVITCIIILIPPVVLLFSGNTYKKKYSRLFGSVLFSMLALVFLIEPISKVVVPTGFGSFVYSWLIENDSFLIGLGLVFAIVDLALTKKPLEMSGKKKFH